MAGLFTGTICLFYKKTPQTDFLSIYIYIYMYIYIYIPALPLISQQQTLPKNHKSNTESQFAVSFNILLLFVS